MRIAFVVVNFNNSAYSVKLAESLERQQGCEGGLALELLVVDNSTDPTDSRSLADGLSRWTWARIVTSGKNLGYFHGLNLGLKSLTGDYDFVVIGNNDLQFRPSFCATLSQSKYENRIQIVCPDVVTVDGGHQNPHMEQRISWIARAKLDLYFSHYSVGYTLRWLSNTFLKPRRPPTHAGSAKEISMGIGACYVLCPSFFEHSKELFFRWFLFGEEACLTWQVRESGGILWYDPSLVVDHAESISCSKLPTRVAYEMGREAYWGYRSLL